MDRWERAGAASGIAFVALALAALYVVPQPPRLGDLGGLIQYASEHRGGLLTQSYLIWLATAALLWFAGSIRAALRRVEGEPGRLSTVAFGGAVGAAVVAMLASFAMAAIAFRIDEAAATPAAQAALAARVRILADVEAIGAAAIFLPIAVLVGATAMLTFRSGVLPRLHAAYGALLAAASAVGGATIFGRTGFFSIDEPQNAGLVLLLAFSAWVLATSVGLMVGETDKIRAATDEEPAKVHWHVRHLRRAAGM